MVIACHGVGGGRRRHLPLPGEAAGGGGGGGGRPKAHLRRADGLAELAGDAPLLARGVAAQRVLPPEAGAQWALLEGVVDGGRLTEQVAQGHGQAWKVRREVRARRGGLAPQQQRTWGGPEGFEPPAEASGGTSEELGPQQGLGSPVGDGAHVHGRLLDVDVLCGDRDAVGTPWGQGHCTHPIVTGMLRPPPGDRDAVASPWGQGCCGHLTGTWTLRPPHSDRDAVAAPWGQGCCTHPIVTGTLCPPRGDRDAAPTQQGQGHCGHPAGTGTLRPPHEEWDAAPTLQGAVCCGHPAGTGTPLCAVPTPQRKSRGHRVPTHCTSPWGCWC